MRKLRNSAIAVVTATALLAGGTAANAAEGSAAKAFDNSISSTKTVEDNSGECTDQNVTNQGNGSTLPEFNLGSVQNHHNSDCNKLGGNTAGKIGTAVEANKAIHADTFYDITKTTFGKLWVALTVLTGIGFVFAASNFVTHYRLHPIF